MPLGIVTPEEYEKELNDTKTVEVLIKQIERGRPIGGKEVPEELKKLIGGDAIENGNGSALSLAQSFGLGTSNHTAYKAGATSPASYQKKNSDLMIFLDKTRTRVTKKASRRLLAALDSMTDDKLSELKPTDAAIVASAMSRVIKDVTPEQRNDTAKVAFQIYAPQVHTNEKHYSVVHVNE